VRAASRSSRPGEGPAGELDEAAGLDEDVRAGETLAIDEQPGRQPLAEGAHGAAQVMAGRVQRADDRGERDVLRDLDVAAELRQVPAIEMEDLAESGFVASAKPIGCPPAAIVTCCARWNARADGRGRRRQNGPTPCSRPQSAIERSRSADAVPGTS
jgi:hypothetical protein